MIQIYGGKPDQHVDKRRMITDTTLEASVNLPFPIRQVKVIDFTEEAVRQRMAVGNHYHPEKSGRQEFFVVLGPAGTRFCMAFFWRKAGEGEQIKEENLMNGDGVYVPPGFSHAFIPLFQGVRLLGLSNVPFRDEDDIADKLF